MVSLGTEETSAGQ